MFKFVFLPLLSVSLALLGSVSFATTEKLEKTAKLVSEDTANNFLRQMSSKLINNSNFEHLQARVGIQNKEQTAEILAVYGLQKSADRFVFNQTSLSRHDGEDTFNTGIGYRFFQNDAVIVGVNGFFDFELGSGHRRMGSGIEFLTEKIELRGNYYHPTTNAKTVNGMNEEALKGHDFSLSYNHDFYVPFTLKLEDAKWYDGKGFTETAASISASYDITPHLSLSIEREKFNGKKAVSNTMLRYSIPLGVTDKLASAPDDRSADLQRALYAPVERENKIRKKSIKLGLTVGSY